MRTLSPRPYVGLVLGVLAIYWAPVERALAQWVPASGDAENPAIAYSTTEPTDPVASLQRAIDAGTAVLQFDDQTGYLRSTLQALRVPVDSQGLVFSQTSFQRNIISPARPRAVYFNRDVYVGWVPDGHVLEIASLDPVLGPIFYTLSQQATRHPRFQRQTRACLQCHDSPSVTGGVPGLIVKSVHADGRGEPIASAKAHLTTDQSPVTQRWGGWYVSGAHGAQPHMGVGLPAWFDTPYLASHSDLVALTVLAHQTHIQNLLTLVGYRTRMALFFDRQRNQDLGQSSDYLPDATRRLIENVAEPLVRAMLFVGEAVLGEPLPVTTGFSSAFARQRPRDAQGRSLFELDLKRRLMRHPCSYLIYSASFDALPAPAKAYIYRRLLEVLRGDDVGKVFAHLSRLDRAAILEILRDTKPEFAAYAR